MSQFLFLEKTLVEVFTSIILLLPQYNNITVVRGIHLDHITASSRQQYYRWSRHSPRYYTISYFPKTATP